MEREISDLLEMFGYLSKEWKAATIWIVEHIDLVDWLVKEENLPKEELDMLKQEEAENNNYIGEAIYMYKKFVDERKSAERRKAPR